MFVAPVLQVCHEAQILHLMVWHRFPLYSHWSPPVELRASMLGRVQLCAVPPLHRPGLVASGHIKPLSWQCLSPRLMLVALDLGRILVAASRTGTIKEQNSAGGMCRGWRVLRNTGPYAQKVVHHS